MKYPIRVFVYIIRALYIMLKILFGLVQATMFMKKRTSKRWDKFLVDQLLIVFQ